MSPRQRWLFTAPALAAAVVVLRSAGFAFDVLNIDEADFALIGHRILQGALPYVEIVDHKPPLTYLAFVPAGWFGPTSLLPMRILAILCVLATSLVVAKAAALWTSDELTGTVAAWLAVLGLSCDLPLVCSELLLNLPAALALFWFVRAHRGGGRRDLWLAGFAIGLASLFKHQAGILLPALALARLFARGPLPARLGGASLDGLCLAVAFLLPWGATFAVYAAAGRTAALVDWVFTRNFAYVSGGSLGGTAALFAHALAICIGGTLVPWVFAVRQTIATARSDDDRTIAAGLVAALWATWIAVSSGGRFYEHYFLQFAPPLAIVAAPAAARFIKAWPEKPIALRRGVAIAAALPVAIGLVYSYARGAAGAYPSQNPTALAIAAWMKANTAPTDTLFVWGHFSPIYYLAKRLPGTRYVHTSVHVGNFDPGMLPEGFDASAHVSARDLEATISDLELNRVPIVIDTAPSKLHGWDHFPLSTVPPLQRYIESHYRKVATAGGADLYRRTSP